MNRRICVHSLHATTKRSKQPRDVVSSLEFVAYTVVGMHFPFCKLFRPFEAVVILAFGLETKCRLRMNSVFGSCQNRVEQLPAVCGRNGGLRGLV